MKLVDANVLIAAAGRDHPHHAIAAAWLHAARTQSERLGLSTLVAMAFLRITTHRRIHASPLSVDQAIDWLRVLATSPAAQWVHPGDTHLDHLHKLLGDADLAGNVVNDAHLAALAMEHGASVVSFDRDFLRFSGLRLELLAASSQ